MDTLNINSTAFITCPILPFNNSSATNNTPLTVHERLRSQRRPPYHRTQIQRVQPPLAQATPTSLFGTKKAETQTSLVEQVDTDKLTGVFNGIKEDKQSSAGDIKASDETDEYEDDNGHPVLVLSFVTSNCRACMYAQNGFARLAREFAGLRTHRKARFYEVDVSDKRNHQLGQQLGVTAVPSFQLYAYKQDDITSVVHQENHDHEKTISRKGAFGVLDELVGARVVGKVRDRLLHYCSEAFDLDEYVFDNEEVA